MKSQTINRLIIAGIASAIAFSLICNHQVKASEKRRFICQTKQLLPRTYTLYEGQKRTLIRWTKALGEKTPQERCDKASSRFQEASN